jgi:hypothetical protein
MGVRERFENWWQALEPEKETHGWFKEIFFPTVERFEAVFSNNEASGGLAYMRENMGGPIRVPGRKNLAIIRSGQDWSNTKPVERKLYLETMHPVLIKGMDFLRDNGEEVGYISNRFMEVIDPKAMTSSTDKTFGLGYFNDLASLERRSK